MRLRLSIRARPASASVEPGTRVAGIERVVEVPFDSGEAVLGRHQGATVELPFPAVSALHARLFRDERGYHIEDLGSANGTWLGRRRLPPHLAESIAIGETVNLAGIEVRFDGELPDASPGQSGEGTATLARRLVHAIFEACPPAECARLVVEAGPALGQELVLLACNRVFTVGRGDLCDLVLADDDVSREHAAFERGAEGIVVRDLESKNGVEVGGSRIAGARILRDGEWVRVGETRLRVVDPEERYLRQMRSGEDALPVQDPLPSAASLVTTAPKAELSSSVPSRLPVVASAIAITTLFLALGLVLALALPF